MANNIHEFSEARPKITGPPSGGDGGLGERMARLETKMERVALREDVLNLKIWILIGTIGGIVTAAGLAVGIVKALS